MDAATQMVIDGQQAFAMIGTVLWTMLRIGALLAAMPLIGTRALPARIRVVLAATLAMALAPILPPVPEWNGFDAAAVLGIARELAIGASMGFMLRLIFEAGALAGEMISQSMGLSFAQMSDPLRGVTSGVVSQWFYIGFGLLFFAANGHLALVALLVDSYKALPIGTALPDVHAFAEVAPTFFLHVLRGGLTLALPMIVAMLAVNLAFGALSRAAPALNPIQLGLPVSLLLGLFLLAMLAGEMSAPVQRMFDAAFDAARQLGG
ncbi:flagellar biosynthetic protein FliR [[Pseudomonas] boreopolis]|uniref:flagellar biosynthetic protein FliR n=1 Tax=Xanthomonas boreopolis TaxID=86183 RepID=UPI003D432503